MNFLERMKWVMDNGIALGDMEQARAAAQAAERELERTEVADVEQVVG